MTFRTLPVNYWYLSCFLISLFCYRLPGVVVEKICYQEGFPGLKKNFIGWGGLKYQNIKYRKKISDECKQLWPMCLYSVSLFWSEPTSNMPLHTILHRKKLPLPTVWKPEGNNRDGYTRRKDILEPLDSKTHGVESGFNTAKKRDRQRKNDNHAR